MISGEEAVLPSSLSFEYTEGNDFFEEGSFSLSISISLLWEQNRRIFGSLQMPGQVLEQQVYPCVLEADGYRREGTLAVDSVENDTVKVQFLAGQSEQALRSTMDTVYINELDFVVRGIYDSDDAQPEPANRSISVPWLNTEEPSVIHNTDNVTNRQPRLLWLTQQVMSLAGFTAVDLAQWEDSVFAPLYVLNALPDTTANRPLARILPHWTVSEFMQQVALLLNAVWVIDYSRKTARLDLLLRRTYPLMIVPSNRIVAERKRELTGDAIDAPARGFAVKYKKTDYELASADFAEGFMSAVEAADNDVAHPLLNDDYTDVETSNVYQDTAQDHHRQSLSDFVFNSNWRDRDFMCANIDYTLDNDVSQWNKGREQRKLWAVLTGAHNAPWACLCSDYEKGGKFLYPIPVNVAGAETASKTKECKIVPCPMAFEHIGHIGVSSASLPYWERTPGRAPLPVFTVPVADEDETTETGEQPVRPMEQLIEGTDTAETPEYFTCLFVAFVDVALTNTLTDQILADSAVASASVQLYTGDVCFKDFYTVARVMYGSSIASDHNLPVKSLAGYTGRSLRRSFIDGGNTLVGSRRLDMSAVYTFQILSEGMPSVNAVYEIDGTLYFPKKITCNISSQNGISIVKKIECYKII
mgnify:CR=1 FL=1